MGSDRESEDSITGISSDGVVSRKSNIKRLSGQRRSRSPSPVFSQTPSMKTSLTSLRSRKSRKMRETAGSPSNELGASPPQSPEIPHLDRSDLLRSESLLPLPPITPEIFEKYLMRWDSLRRHPAQLCAEVHLVANALRARRPLQEGMWVHLPQLRDRNCLLVLMNFFQDLWYWFTKRPFLDPTTRASPRRQQALVRFVRNSI